MFFAIPDDSVYGSLEHSSYDSTVAACGRGSLWIANISIINIEKPDDNWLMVRAIVPKKGAQRLAENFSGKEENTATRDAEIDDVVGEFINIITGKFIAEIDSNIGYSIGTPQVLRLTSKDEIKLEIERWFIQKDSRIVFIIDSVPVLIEYD